MTTYRMEVLFPQDIEARLRENPLLVIGFGTIEWHSHHLPLGLDGLVAEGLCERIADQADAVLAPVSYWGVGGVPYPYTLNLPIAVIEPLLLAVFEQFGAMGFRVITALTGHFGLEQTLTLKRAALAVMRRSPVTILPLTEYDLTTEFYTGDHAGVGETSLMWALRPDLVRLDAVPADTPLDGVLGADPRTDSASAERGEQIIGEIAARAAAVSRRLLKQTSPVQRADYLEALGMGVRVLERTLAARNTMPKREVPSVTTPAYLAYCQALHAGDYRTAFQHAERKYADLAE